MRRLLIGALCLVLSSAGCASAGGLKGNVYRDEETAYAIARLDEPWRRIRLDGADLSFRHERAGAVIQINSRCRRSDDVPLRALLGQLLIGFTGRDVEREQIVDLDRREALQVVLSARLDGVPVRLGVYVLKKDGCVYDFTLVAAPESFGRVQSEFDRFVTQFRTLRRED